MLMYSLVKELNVPKHTSRQLMAEYHAELFDEDRMRIAEEFRKADSHMRCLIATVAFGMGIDIPDIRYIIHWGESNSVTGPSFGKRLAELGELMPQLKPSCTTVESS